MKDKVFAGLNFKFQRTGRYGTYWQRGVLGMILLPNGSYSCHTLEADIEGNPCYSWDGDDPHQLVREALAFHRERTQRWDHTFLPDGP